LVIFYFQAAEILTITVLFQKNTKKKQAT